MAELCNRCRNQRLPDRSARESLSAPGGSASMQAALNELRNRLEVEKRQEDLVYRSQGRGVAALERRPVLHAWCVAQSKTREGLYHFCDWLKADTCSYFESAESAPAPESKPATVVRISPTSAAERTPPSPPPKVEEWSLPLGAAYRLRAVSRPIDDGALGAGSFQIDYEAAKLDERPAISGAGLAQTYLIFGGPGAGKTYYFKHLLSSLLAHERRPGCLLLDPKGALTGCLKGSLEKIGRSKDLFLIAAGANESAFNVLSPDFPPKELGRL